MQIYMNMFGSASIRERDPTQDARLTTGERIMSTLAESSSLENIGSRVPLLSMNKQIDNIDSSVKSLSNQVKTITK